MGVSDRARASALVGRPVRRLFLGVAVLAVLGTVAGLSLPPVVRYVPLALSVVVLGLPHGAVDHLVPSRLGGRGGLPAVSTRRGALAVALGYLLLGGAYTLVWLTAPVVAALAFVGLTWFHWGQGDLWVLRELYGATHLRSRWMRLATVAVRGGLPMLVPLLAAPERYRAVVAAWVALFDASLGLSWLFAVETRLLLGAGFGLLTLGTLALGRRHIAETVHGRATWRVDAAEVAVLWVVFLAVPPLVAVGLYFTCWHALRHVVRLVRLDRTDVLAASRGAQRPFLGFARDALPLTLLSLLLLAGFGPVVPGSVETVPEYAALYLVFISVVTLPHVVVVGLMDRAEGVWADSPDRPATTAEEVPR